MTTSTVAPSVTTTSFDRRQIATVGGAMLGFFVVALDAQIVNVALPDIAAQARGLHPMVPLGMFGSRQLSVALAIAFTSMAAFYGVVFVQSLYFQQQRGESPLMTGLLFLPMTGLVTIVSSQAASLVARFGRRALITTGLLVQCLGLVVIAALPADVSIWWRRPRR